MFLHHCHLHLHFLVHGRYLLTPKPMVPNLQGHHQIPLCHSSQLHLRNRRLSSAHRRRSHCLPPSVANTGASLLITTPSQAPRSMIQMPPLNYSNPAVLTAIQRFNSKIFSKSIILILYDTPHQ
ncbi:hypothetical protein MA16_Dca001313 [Dendrobium catenatum]|uniref:Uncharacterized protein n=1 Tax=Dendrobium catenatum TaxID=906689 RepID=A0A2I0WM36_9ASPA|nr:hypothetical protein MA16_Dca001313 [Dendrobium catenatum]